METVTKAAQPVERVTLKEARKRLGQLFPRDRYHAIGVRCTVEQAWVGNVWWPSSDDEWGRRSYHACVEGCRTRKDAIAALMAAVEAVAKRE